MSTISNKANSTDLVPSVRYALPDTFRKQVVSIDQLTAHPDGPSSSIEHGSSASFTINPNDTFLKGDSVYFSLRLKTDNATDDLRGPIQRIIRRVRVRSANASTVLEDIDNYNVLDESVVRNCFMGDQFELATQQPENYYPVYDSDGIVVDAIRASNDSDFSHSYQDNSTALESVTDASVTSAGLVGTTQSARSQYGVQSNMYNFSKGQLFVFKLRAVGLFGAGVDIPLKAVQGLRIEIDFEQGSIAMNTGSSYTVNDLRMYYTTRKLSQQAMAAVSQQFNSKRGIPIMISTFQNRNQTFSGSNLVLPISSSATFANMLFLTKRAVSELAAGSNSFNFSPTDMFENSADPVGSYQVEYDSHLMPRDEIQSLERAFVESRHACQTADDVSLDINNFGRYIDDRFVLATNLQSLPGMDQLSGLDLKGGDKLRAHVKLDSGNSTAYRVDAFLMYQRVIWMSANGIAVEQ